MDIAFTASIRLRSNGTAPASWHFVTLPKDTAEQVQKFASAQPRAGFGSIKVEARIGTCTWKTSIFPDKKTGSYLLPIKGDVRKDLHIGDGDTVYVAIRCLTK